MRVEGTYRDIWAIAWPIMLASLGNTIINFTDVAFVGRIGEAELAASALGGVFYMLLVMIGVAVATGSQIMIARREGEGASDRVGEVVLDSFKLLMGFGLVMSVLLFTLIPGLLNQLIRDENIAAITALYLKARTWGLIPMLVLVLVRCFYIGIANTRIITYTTIIMVVMNILLNYVFVFGAVGIDPMGIKGSGYASACAEAIAAVYALVYTAFSGFNKRYVLFRTWRSTPGIKSQLVKLSAPMMLQHFLSMGAWFLFFILIEKLGSRELAVSNVVRSVYMVLMTPVWGIAQATNSMISNIIGQGRSSEVLRISGKLAIAGFVVCIVGVLLSIVFMDPLLGLCTEDLLLVELARDPFLIVCLATLFFGPAMVLVMAVSGTGMTSASLRVELSSILLYLVYLVWVTLLSPSNLIVVWLTELIYWFSMGGLSLIYLRSGKWMQKVI